MGAARVYLDNSATTRLDPRVAAGAAGEAGNPSSLHAEGRSARAAVDRARGQVAALLGAASQEIVFTASGTEANNLALRGVVAAAGGGGHLVISAVEHPAVLETCRYLAGQGVAVTLLPVGADGIADPAVLDDALRPDTRLVSVMTANNVVGTLQPVAAYARAARARGVPFHTDAVQAVGRIPLDVVRDGVDLLSLSAHKFHGPQGVGALYVRRGVALAPIVHGGGQERGLRSATENVAGLVGLGEAAAIAAAEAGAEAARLVALRDELLAVILAQVPGAYLVGDPRRRLPGHLCLGFAGHEGEAIRLLLDLDARGFAVSTGSACSAHHAGEPSHVLQAMGFDPVRARGSLRVTLGRFNTRQEILSFAAALREAVAGLRPGTTTAAQPRLSARGEGHVG